MAQAPLKPAMSDTEKKSLLRRLSAASVLILVLLFALMVYDRMTRPQDEHPVNQLPQVSPIAQPSPPVIPGAPPLATAPAEPPAPEPVVAPPPVLEGKHPASDVPPEKPAEMSPPASEPVRSPAQASGVVSKPPAMPSGSQATARREQATTAGPRYAVVEPSGGRGAYAIDPSPPARPAVPGNPVQPRPAWVPSPAQPALPPIPESTMPDGPLMTPVRPALSPLRIALPTILQSTRGYDVQLGNFQSTETVEELKSRLNKAGLPVHTEVRISLGPFKNREEALAAQQKLRSLGIVTGNKP